MSSSRVHALLPCIAALVAAAALSGCASSRLASQMPPGSHLAGDWKLDPARSDDLGRAVTQLRDQARKRHDERMRRAPRDTGGYRQGAPGRRQRPDDERGGENPEQASEGESAGIGPAPHVPAADELLASVPQGEYLRITASAGGFTVISGSSSEQYTPGLPSEISAQQGDAQQISGWKGTDYVIDTRPQWGPQIRETYAITPDGALKLTVELSGQGTHFVFTRIYDRTNRVSPLAPPTND